MKKHKAFVLGLKKIMACMVVFVCFVFAACTDYLQKLEDEHDEWWSQQSKAIVESSSSVSNQYDYRTELDIIIRDFDVSHPDFENFQEEAYNSIKNGGNCIGEACVGEFPDTWLSSYTSNADWMFRRSDYASYGCGNAQTPEYGIAVGANGFPHDLQTASGVQSTVPDYIKSLVDQSGYTWYGEFKDCQYDAKWNPLGFKVMRGFVTDLCSDASGTWSANMKDDAKSCHKVCKTHSWSQIVYITPGMVEQKLKIPAIGGALDMYEPTITRARYACDNQFFEQWYADGSQLNKRTNATLIMDRDPSAPLYFEIDRNWNNGGYFPLDSLDANQSRVINQTGVVYPSGRANQYGPQSLSIICPPYDYQWASSQTDNTGESTTDLCKAWLNAGGPKTGTAAITAAASDAGLLNGIGMRHLRNYGFTMMGYATLKYHKGAKDVLKFVSGDDLWIFIDGVLVADLGGVHLPAIGVVDLDFLSSKGHGCYQGDPLLDSCAVKLDVDGTWLDESWHHLHFFYASRQSGSSTLYMRITSP